jgi:hypothetical protein
MHYDQCFVYGIRTVLIFGVFDGTSDVDCWLNVAEIWHRADLTGLAPIACLQSFHIYSCGYNNMSADAFAVERVFEQSMTEAG